MIEKCFSEIQARLAQAIRSVRPDSADLVKKMINGDRMLAPRLKLPAEDILCIVSLPVVRQGAAVLEKLEPEALFPSPNGHEGWCRDNYAEWRQAYLEASEHSEEIVVGVSM